MPLQLTIVETNPTYPQSTATFHQVYTGTDDEALVLIVAELKKHSGTNLDAISYQQAPRTKEEIETEARAVAYDPTHGVYYIEVFISGGPLSMTEDSLKQRLQAIAVSPPGDIPPPAGNPPLLSQVVINALPQRRKNINDSDIVIQESEKPDPRRHSYEYDDAKRFHQQLSGRGAGAVNPVGTTGTTTTTTTTTAPRTTTTAASTATTIAATRAGRRVDWLPSGEAIVKFIMHPRFGVTLIFLSLGIGLILSGVAPVLLAAALPTLSIIGAVGFALATVGSLALPYLYVKKLYQVRAGLARKAQELNQRITDQQGVGITFYTQGKMNQLQRDMRSVGPNVFQQRSNANTVTQATAEYEQNNR